MMGMICPLSLSSCQAPEKKQQVAATDYTAYVDPYIGSGEHGHVFVGANVLSAPCRSGRRTFIKDGTTVFGYHYSDSVIIGFSHTHLSGTGCAENLRCLCDAVCRKSARHVANRTISKAHAPLITSTDRSVAPEELLLPLMDNGVKVELTSTERVAMHHYTFPKNQAAHLLIDLKEGNGDKSYDTYLKKSR